MSRKPAYIEAQLQVRVSRGYQGVWEIVRERKFPFTVQDITADTNSSETTVRQYLASLKLAGYLNPVKIQGDPRFFFSRAVDFGPIAPRLRRDGTPVGEMGRGQDNMWRTIKMLKSFSPLEVAIHASTDDVQVSEGAAKSYLARLAWAGYIKRERGDTGRYRFLPSWDTGPLAPQIMRTKFVFDPNLKEVRGPASTAIKVLA
ncbi:MAG: hypothetical protein HQM01_14330 [Magnetococcales bacterium]|nr:hypothetical protein [Magnetococcales bacterium]